MMRRVAAGEATNFDGVLHKGLPLRVLNNKNNDLLLKDDGYDESAPMDNWREGAEMLEGSLEECVTKLSDLLSKAMDVAIECEEYGLSAKYSTALQDMHTSLQEEGLGE